MTDAQLSALLIAWDNRVLGRAERQQYHDAAAREFARRGLASKSGATFLDVDDVRYSLEEDGRVGRSLPL